MKFEIFNRIAESIDVILEPVGDSFQIPPEMTGEIDLANDRGVRIDIHQMNHINIWVEGHVTVKIGDSTMEFSQIT